MADRIAVLDFGGQYAHLIARRVRQLGVLSEILPPNTVSKQLKEYKGIILSGGPASVQDADAPPFNTELFSLGIPILGLCYGQQLMVQQLGGEVRPGQGGEYGKSTLVLKKTRDIFSGLGPKEKVWMSHGDQVQTVPKGFETYGTTADCPHAAIGDRDRKMYGLQFHPEVTHTPHGKKILENFVRGVCQCAKEWSIENYIRQEGEVIREKVGEKKVFMLVSGGVDSVVTLALLEKTLQKGQVVGLHIDTGLMRKNESMEVKQALEALNLSDLHTVDASTRFFDALQGITDPEEKRKSIGKLFVEEAAAALEKLNLNTGEWILGQGTIYPDTIESGKTEHSAVIKTHHNRIEQLQRMEEAGKVIEPLSMLYKDEVRELGRELGLRETIVNRHPFPGPGLGIRILCSDGKSTVKEWRKANDALQQLPVAQQHSMQLLPVKSTGVQGDYRTYRFATMLQQHSYKWDELEGISTRITNQCKETNRVVMWMGKTPAESVELMEGMVTRERADVLREADAAVMRVMQKHQLMDRVWQFPVILVPVSINGKGECIVLRPIQSMEAMTAEFARLPEAAVKEMVQALSALPGIGGVLYDITHKPPGTICWE